MSYVGIKNRRIASGTADQMPEDEPPWQPEHLVAADDLLRTRIGTQAAAVAARYAREVMEASRGIRRTAALDQEVHSVSVNNGAQRTLF